MASRFTSRGATCFGICLGARPAIRPARFHQSPRADLLSAWMAKYSFGSSSLLGPSSAQSGAGLGNFCWWSDLGHGLSTRPESLRLGCFTLFDDLGTGGDSAAGRASTLAHRFSVFWVNG